MTATGESSRPMRPFNAVQWIGVGLVGAGIAVMLAVVAGRFGLVPTTRDSLPMGTAFCVLGTVLINTRREAVPVTPETKRRRLIVIGIALAVCAIVAAAVFFGGQR